MLPPETKSQKPKFVRNELFHCLNSKYLQKAKKKKWDCQKEKQKQTEGGEKSVIIVESFAPCRHGERQSVLHPQCICPLGYTVEPFTISAQIKLFFVLPNFWEKQFVSKF